MAGRPFLRSLGASADWFWFLGLFVFAPAFVAEAGLIESLLVWFTESDHSLTVAVEGSDVRSIISPVDPGRTTETGAAAYLALALGLLLTGRCGGWLPKLPLAVVGISLLAAAMTVRAGLPLIAVGAWLVLTVTGLIAERGRRAGRPSWPDDARIALALFALLLGVVWMSAFPLAIVLVSLAAFGFAPPPGIDRWVVLSLVVASVAAATLLGGDGEPTTARYVAYAFAAALAAVQFGRSARILSKPVLLFLVLAAATAWGVFDGGGLPADGSDQSALLTFESPLRRFAMAAVNGWELIGLVLLLLLARWAGLIAWQNRLHIQALRNHAETASYFKDALWASRYLLGIAAGLWLLGFHVTGSARNSIAAHYAEEIAKPGRDCPTGVHYRLSPTTSDVTFLARAHLARERLETRRCFEYKIGEGVDATQRTADEVNAIAKAEFLNLWPQRFPGTQTENCDPWEITCHVRNGIKSLVNARYVRVRDAAVVEFNAELDELVSNIKTTSDSGGSAMEDAVLRKLDDSAHELDLWIVSVSRIDALLGVVGTTYLLLLALKLYLSVLARFVFGSGVGDFPTPLSTKGFARGGVRFDELARDTDKSVQIEVAGWQFAKTLTLANVTYEGKHMPYQPGFAPFRRMGKWYRTQRASPTGGATHPPAIVQQEVPSVFVVAAIGDGSALLFEPGDLVGFTEGVVFSVEWNYRLISLVFCRHRYCLAEGPGKVMLRFPEGATDDKVAAPVTSVRMLDAAQNLKISAFNNALDVAFTEETISFAKGAAWVGPSRKWRGRWRRTLAFIWPF